MADEDDLDAAARAVLAATGPIPIKELIDRLDDELLEELRLSADDDAELAEILLDGLIQTDDMWNTPGDIIALTHPLLDGLTLTHRLSADEIAAEQVPAEPDLSVLDWDAPDGLDLTKGRLVSADLESLAGPPGWLAGFAAGDLLAFTRRGSSVSIERVDEPTDDTAELEALRAAIEPRIPAGTGEEASPLVLDALTADPTLFGSAKRPVGELLEAAGLERRGFSFGRAGGAWLSLPEQLQQRDRTDIGRRWGFERCCDSAYDAVLDAFAGFPDTEMDPVVVARSLAHGIVAWPVAERLLDGARARFADDGGALVGSFAGALVEGGRGKSAAAAWLLAALAAERSGDARGAEAALRAARRTDPDYLPAAWELSNYEVDRGEIDRAIALLHLGDPTDAPALPFLEGFRDEVMARYEHVGRNERCPCGSGRKFKTCCQRDPKVALTHRSRFLLHKLGSFLARPHRRSQLIGVASSALDPDDPGLVSALAERAADPIICDFLLFDGGIIEEYLDERGHLLPADERGLLEYLAVEPRRLWEVVAVEEGSGLSLRDTKTGDVVSVNERSGSVGRRVGELVLARVAPVGDEIQIFAIVVTVPLRLRDSAIELVDSNPDADALASWYGAALAPPTLFNRDGHLFVPTRAELETGEPVDAVMEVMDDLFEREQVGPLRDHRWVWLGDDGTVLGTVTFDEGTWYLDTNSEERLDRLMDLLGGALPDAEFLDVDIDDGDTDDWDVDGWEDDEDEDLNSPEMEAALDEIMRRHEEGWVDESIPALGGLTPRQALDDPTRREDLFALLREFEARPAPPIGRSFDVGRIRRLLGIEGDA